MQKTELISRACAPPRARVYARGRLWNGLVAECIQTGYIFPIVTFLLLALIGAPKIGLRYIPLGYICPIMSVHVPRCGADRRAAGLLFATYGQVRANVV